MTHFFRKGHTFSMRPCLLVLPFPMSLWEQILFKPPHPLSPRCFEIISLVNHARQRKFCFFHYLRVSRAFIPFISAWIARVYDYLCHHHMIWLSTCSQPVNLFCPLHISSDSPHGHYYSYPGKQLLRPGCSRAQRHVTLSHNLSKEN